MKLAFICLSLMMLWPMCVCEEVPTSTEVDPQQVRNIVAYGVSESQDYYRQSAPFYKPGISDLKSVGGAGGLLLLGLPSGKYGPPARDYLPRGQNQDLHNPYDQSLFGQRPFISQSPFPYSKGQRYRKVMGNTYSRIPTSWIGYPSPHRPLNNYNPSFIPGPVYKPGVKDLTKYGGVEGLLRLGLPSALLNH
ncbi:uncharacterized protein [Haliotis asinina]|uniref:uncharacterized protein n=1 Tax=Haliotis asinina TaxID=109174 RepID=UPI003531A0F6